MHFVKQWAKVALVSFAAFGIVTSLPNFVPVAFAQTAVSGSINGTVMDSSGAVVPNATVTILDTATGDTRVLTTNADGRYTAPFLKPDKFDVSATAPGLQSTSTSVQVLTGQQTLVNVTVSPTANKETVTVNANNAQLIDTQSANLTTTFTTQQFQNLPAPGGDITTIAYTLPGVVVSAGGSYGNFSSDGLPGISNLVIINGADDNDPFLNLNNSGSSNLTIGQEEIAQASVVQNGYTVEYGRQAGAIETYVTKAGANRVHGLLQWNYNSSGLNANDFFNNHFGVPKPKAVSNQYAAQIGGPILHDKLFFFADTEGIRYILPTSSYLNFPSAALQNTILNTIPGGPTGSGGSLYSKMFGLLATSPAYGRATPITTGTGGLQDSSGNLGCASITGTPVFGATNEYFGAAPKGSAGTSISCFNAAFTTATNLNREWFAAGRVDWNINDKHKLFARFTDDQGSQPTFTSAINPVLNAQSIQPSYSGQLNDTYIFTPNLTNQLILTGLYYSAIFEPVNIQATLAASPTLLYEPNDGGTNSAAGIGQGGNTGFEYYNYPQGRNVTQYQIVDDLSWLKGNHNFKVGVNLKRDDVTDVGNEINTYGGYYSLANALTFENATLPGNGASVFTQAFTTVPAAHSAIYNLGVYAQDEWKVKPNFVLDYGVRVDRNGNPACTTNCFSHYVGGFPAANASQNEPYNSVLSTGHRSAFPSVEMAIIQPRVGFNWDTNGQGKTVVRGGMGLFADTFPAFIIGSEYGSFPNVFAPLVLSGTVSQGPGSPIAAAATANSIVTPGFKQGGSYNSLSAQLPPGGYLPPPTYFTTPGDIKAPRYLEYNLQVQHQLTPSDAVILNYAGSHGYNLLMGNGHLNQTYANSNYNGAGATFNGLTLKQADPSFAGVSNVSNIAKSNYNGVSVELKHIDRHGITADVAYTYSHSLDDISNGGVGLPFNGGAVTTQITTNSPSLLMYSSSDYDIRNNLVADLTYVETQHFSSYIKTLGLGGWTVAGKAYWRSGEPFSVFNVNANNGIANGTGGTTVLADVLNNNFNHTCLSFSKPCFQTPGIFNGAGYGFNSAGNLVVLGGNTAQNNFGNVPRNSFRGPHYADVDATVYKDIFQRGSTQFQIGAQAYNVLNHVNFGQPGNNASNTSTLGVISTDISAPTSPYGSFQGSVVSGRVLVVQGRLTF